MREIMNILEEAMVSPSQMLVQNFHAGNINVDLEATDPETVWIGWVERPYGVEAGAAKVVLGSLNQMADELGVTLELRVAVGDERLVEYYQTLGFVVSEVTSDGTFMLRLPSGSQ